MYIWSSVFGRSLQNWRSWEESTLTQNIPTLAHCDNRTVDFRSYTGPIEDRARPFGNRYIHVLNYFCCSRCVKSWTHSATADLRTPRTRQFRPEHSSVVAEVQSGLWLQQLVHKCLFSEAHVICQICEHANARPIPRAEEY